VSDGARYVMIFGPHGKPDVQMAQHLIMSLNLEHLLVFWSVPERRPFTMEEVIRATRRLGG
jgi:hypothetical protein